MPIAPAKAVAAVLVLGAGSVLAYNWATTGCPSGVCRSERAASSAVLPAAGTGADPSAVSGTCAMSGSCPMSGACQDADGCPMSGASSCGHDGAMNGAEPAASALPACCAELGHAACGDPSACAGMQPAEKPPASGTTTEPDADQAP